MLVRSTSDLYCIVDDNGNLHGEITRNEKGLWEWWVGCITFSRSGVAPALDSAIDEINDFLRSGRCQVAQLVEPMAEQRKS